MSSFIDELMKNYGSEMVSHVSQNLGLSSKTVEQIIPNIVPVILGGLKKQKDAHGGIEGVENIMKNFGTPDILNNLSDLFREKAKEENPDPTLNGLLGNSGLTAAKAISKKFNIDESIAKKLIPMVAPVIFGALMKKKDEDGLGANGLIALLDRDGDGSILDDVAGFFFNNSGSPQKGKSGNLIGGLIGSIFGKKR